MKARITVLTAGHLSTCPRMLKAADALDEAGYAVRLVSARFMDWAIETDRELRARRAASPASRGGPSPDGPSGLDGPTGGWRSSEVDFQRGSPRSAYLRSGVRYRASRWLAGVLGPSRTPGWIAVRAYSRIHSELLAAALAEPADLFYAGSNGALAAAAAAARRQGVPYALDLEDFHRAEHADQGEGRLGNRLAERIEPQLLAEAAFLTAGSAAIAAAYHDAYRVSPLPIHNVFQLPAVPPQAAAPTVPAPGAAPSAPASGGLRLYWFSQTIGPGRGLEDAVRAMGRAGLPGELHLRGRATASYLEALRRLAFTAAPALRVVTHPPASPDQMVELCRGYDVGLALEQPEVANRAIALSNKPLTYILAGLPVAITAVAGNRELARDLGEGALVYAPGDVGALAAGLARWAADRTLLAAAAAAAWDAARRRWHWEHPAERGALLAAVAGVVG